MTDGTYPVRLILRDKQGRVYKESKTFVIASKPPVVRVQLDKAALHSAATRCKLRVSASQSTGTITARLYGTLPVHFAMERASQFECWPLVCGASGGRFL